MHSIKRSTNHTFRLQSLSQERLTETVQRNLDDMEFILNWMDNKNLRLFRIGSSLIPLASHPVMRKDAPGALDWVEIAKSRLATIGQKYAEKNFRFSMHPGQFNVLNSEKSSVVESTIAELDYACRVLELMGLDTSHKVVLHGGCRCGDIKVATQRLIKAIDMLPERIRKRLVLENDERIFSLEQIIIASEAARVPVVFDIHHHHILPSDNLPELLLRLHKTWKDSDGVPKFHISSQRPKSKAGAHDNMVLPDDVKELCNIARFPFDLMVEAKHKETATLDVVETVRKLGCFYHPPTSVI